MVRRTPSDYRPSDAASMAASVDLSGEGAVDAVMGWLALYVPTWGTSVVLHIAIILLAAFMAWRPPAVVEEWVVTGTMLPDKPVNVERRPRPTDKPSQGQGKLRPGESSLAKHVMHNPIPDVATNHLAQLQVIGIDGGGDRIGGLGIGGGRGIFDPSDGTAEQGRRIVYVVDRSGSMTDSFDIVKMELKRSISDLDDTCEFHVIFYSSGAPVEMPSRRLMSATDRNRQLAFEFIDGVIPQGETDPSKALERAFACQPDLIYLLTDGEFDRAIVDLVRRLNVGGKVRVNTIGFLYTGNEKVLRAIAEQNGGQYKFISERDLATIIGG
jgi:hypothetical protein